MNPIFLQASPSLSSPLHSCPQSPGSQINGSLQRHSSLQVLRITLAPLTNEETEALSGNLLKIRCP